MDTVFVEQLAVKTTIGVYEWEKKIKQTLILDLEMQHDSRKAGLSDDIKDALDYFSVSQQVSDFISNNQFELIEKVAQDVANLIFSQFNVAAVTITVRKPGAVENATNVGIKIQRQNPNLSNLSD